MTEVTGYVRHRGERIEFLRARDARDGVHRQDGRLPERESLDQLLVLRGPDKRDEPRSFLHQVGLVAFERRVHLRFSHLEDQVGLAPHLEGIRDDARAGFFVGLIGERRGVAGAGFDDDIEAEFGQLRCHAGDDGHPALAWVDLLRDTELQSPRCSFRWRGFDRFGF